MKAPRYDIVDLSNAFPKGIPTQKVAEEFKEIEKTKKTGEMRAHTSQEESQSADSGLNHTLQHSPYNDNTSTQQILSTPASKKTGELPAHTIQEKSSMRNNGLNQTPQHSPYNDNTSAQQILSTPVLYVYDIFETYLNQRIPTTKHNPKGDSQYGKGTATRLY